MRNGHGRAFLDGVREGVAQVQHLAGPVLVEVLLDYLAFVLCGTQDQRLEILLGVVVHKVVLLEVGDSLLVEGAVADDADLYHLRRAAEHILLVERAQEM